MLTAENRNQPVNDCEKDQQAVLKLSTSLVLREWLSDGARKCASNNHCKFSLRKMKDHFIDNTQVVAAAGFAFIVLCLFYTYLRRVRVSGSIPGFLPKSLHHRWQTWQPKGKYKSVDDQESRGSRLETNTAYGGRDETAANNAVAAGVDRNTSVRSVMTLPAYSQTPKESEQVLGREGERAGMDTVVEFPETVEEEESVRETEMESLYQIREARRREIAEREERRQERREARERGDRARLEELRREARQRSQARNSSTGNLTADILIAEHQSRPKERRVSSVAYASVGQVRHDGTRLRANSTESERGGLLSDAASMGESHARNMSDTGSLLTLDNLSRPSLPFAGGRQRSDSGALSISTVSSFDFPQPTPTTSDEPRRSGENSSTADSLGNSRYTPPATEDEIDIDPRIVSMIQTSDDDIMRPPQYEQHDWGDAPAYEEQLRRAESQRAARLAVPIIQVQTASEPNSPALGRLSEDNEHQRR